MNLEDYLYCRIREKYKCVIYKDIPKNIHKEDSFTIEVRTSLSGSISTIITHLKKYELRSLYKILLEIFREKEILISDKKFLVMTRKIETSVINIDGLDLEIVFIEGLIILRALHRFFNIELVD